MKSEIKFRNYRAADLDAMFRLDEACFAEDFRFDVESMRAFAEGQGAVSVIAESDGELVGFLIVHLERTVVGRRGYVVTLDVAEKWRREGVAGRLVGEAERRVAAAGARWMELHVYTGNEGAIRFYERMGYKRVAVERKFYGKSGLDALVYRKMLAAT
jgi:ribosomal-protein-alanine N-acetyltransferase